MNLALVFQSGDPVLIGVFVIMIAMSIISWVVILMQVIKRISTNKANRAASEAIWSSDSIASAESQAKKNPAPVSELTLAAIDANRSFNAAQNTMLSASLPKNEFLEREIRHSTTQIMGRYDNGMTALASIGATAPFVGLLGTVWGIYHALINIGESGQMSIAAVAGPIGEALVSTAIDSRRTRFQRLYPQQQKTLPRTAQLRPRFACAADQPTRQGVRLWLSI